MPPFAGRIGLVALAAATVRVCPGSVTCERCRRVQVDCPVGIRETLMDKIAADKEALEEFMFDADGENLAARVYEFVGIVARDRIEIKPKPSELLFIESFVCPRRS